MVKGLLSKHIDNGDINIKKKNSGKISKKSPMSKNYSNYLNKSHNNTNTNIKKEDIKLNVIKRDDKVPQKQNRKVVKLSQPKKVVKLSQPKNVVKLPQPKQKVDRLSRSRSRSKQIRKIDKKNNRKLSRKSLKRKTSKRKRLHKKHTKSRRISFRCYPQKDNINIEKMLEKADKMSDETIKKELLKNGIEIKTNNNKLLKDMYMFSNMGGIRINKE